MRGEGGGGGAHPDHLPWGEEGGGSCFGEASLPPDLSFPGSLGLKLILVEIPSFGYLLLGAIKNKTKQKAKVSGRNYILIGS